MADFLEAFTAMWNNEGEVWGRKVGGVLWLFRIQNKAIQAKTMKERDWGEENSVLDSEDQQATDWRKVDLSRKEVPWWEAWAVAQETGCDFWYLRDGEAMTLVNYKDDWSDWTIIMLLEEAQRNTRWFIPAEAPGQ